MNDPKPKLAKPAGAPASTTASERVRERIQAAGRRFHANDNIAEFIQGEAELKGLEEEVTGKLQGLLESLVIDTEGDHNTRGTARRVARMFLRSEERRVGQECRARVG